MTEPSVDSPLTTQRSSLMESESYADWLRAWEPIRAHLPADVTTFRECDTRLGLAAHGFVVNNLLYDLHMALHNAGIEDARLTHPRASAGVTWTGNICMLATS